MKLVLVAIFLLVFPYVIIRLCEKFKILGKIGAVILSFISGIALSISGILPENSHDLIENFMNFSVIIALPMLLFGSDLRTWKKLAGKTILSFAIGMISLIITVTIGYLIWSNEIAEAHNIGGMMVGLYTGGTPNLAALKSALGVSSEVYIMVNTYDLFYGVVFLLSIMTFGKYLLKFVLPRFKYVEESAEDKSKINTENINENPFIKDRFKHLLLSFGLSIIIAVISLALSFIITGDVSMLLLILSLSSLSLIAGFNKRVQKIEGSFSFGMYFILIFSLSLASLVDIESLQNISFSLFFYIGFTIFATLFLHILFSAIFRIDRDTTIVTSTALVCSPPFVPMIADAVKNKQVILPGISIGIIGYAIGNYLGVVIAWVLKNWF